MDGQELIDQIQLYLPKYLSPADAKGLWSELSRFPENQNFYLNSRISSEGVFQGDGWRGFVVLDFHTGNRRPVSGVVLSNSCDIDPDNKRARPANVLFSPLVALDKFVELLRAKSLTEQQIDDKVLEIKRQRITSMFFLPESPSVVPESIVLFDDIHVHPATDFFGRERSFLFTLNLYAFYLLLMKLSIHFSRFQEGIRRLEIHDQDASQATPIP